MLPPLHPHTLISCCEAAAQVSSKSGVALQACRDRDIGSIRLLVRFSQKRLPKSNMARFMTSPACQDHARLHP